MTALTEVTVNRLHGAKKGKPSAKDECGTFTKAMHRRNEVDRSDIDLFASCPLLFQDEVVMSYTGSARGGREARPTNDSPPSADQSPMPATSVGDASPDARLIADDEQHEEREVESGREKENEEETDSRGKDEVMMVVDDGYQDRKLMGTEQSGSETGEGSDEWGNGDDEKSVDDIAAGERGVEGSEEGDLVESEAELVVEVEGARDSDREEPPLTELEGNGQSSPEVRKWTMCVARGDCTLQSPVHLTSIVYPSVFHVFKKRRFQRGTRSPGVAGISALVESKNRFGCPDVRGCCVHCDITFPLPLLAGHPFLHVAEFLSRKANSFFFVSQSRSPGASD